MTTRYLTALAGALTVLALICATPSVVEGQGRGRGRGGGGGKDDGATVAVAAAAGVTLSVELKTQIRDFYAARPATNVESLPPGIRRNLARGKPLPPGIAKRSAPPELASRLPLRDGFEIVEVGLDVFLVEVATNVVHDVLMDVIR